MTIDDVRRVAPYDSRGVPIYPGDLVRSFHFRSRRRTYYLYHVACEIDGYVRIVPAGYLNPTTKRTGGDCLLSAIGPENLTVIQGYGPSPYLDFTDRPRKRAKKFNEHPLSRHRRRS